MNKVNDSNNERKKNTEVPTLKVPVDKKFNPRIENSDSNDERFFAFESQKSHH